MRGFQPVSKYVFPKVQVSPKPESITFSYLQKPVAVYEFGLRLPKPFVFPFQGPSGESLTRYGHPNPQSNHDHHRSIWFGHQFVRSLAVPEGKTEAEIQKEWNFWEEPRPNSDVRIRHSRILALEDSSHFGAAAVESIWWAGGQGYLRQVTVFSLVPLDRDEHALDVQTEFHSIDRQAIELGKSNFGLMGVRVSKTISSQFGGGTILNSEGAVGEQAIFGKPARWVDYSGPTGPDREEGICYMDHPENPRHPAGWHVRSDGWMIASITMKEAWNIVADHPLKLRYRLLAHRGAGPQVKDHLESAWNAFANENPYQLEMKNGRLPQIIRPD